MDAVVRPPSGSVMIGSSQFSSTLSRLNMDGDSDSERSERAVSSLLAGPALLQYDDTADVATDEDGDEEEDEDDYEFQDDYVYDISSRLREVNAAHFAEPLPSVKENRVRFADDPVDRVVCYSPTPLLDVDERLQLKKEYLIKLFAKNESELGDNQSDESDLFSSSDDEDFVDRSHKTPSPIVEIPRTPSPPKDREKHGEKEGYSSDDETEEGDSADGEDHDASATNRKSQTATTTSTSVTLDNSNVDSKLDSKIMEMIEQSVKSADHQASSDAAKNLKSQIRSSLQESLKNEPVKATAEREELPTGPINGDVVCADNNDQVFPNVTKSDNAVAIDATGTPADADTPKESSVTTFISDEETKNEVGEDDTKFEEKVTPSPEPPAVTLNDSKRDMVRQSSVNRQPPRNLPIKSSQAAGKSPTSSPTKATVEKAKSPPESPSRRSLASPRRGAHQVSVSANAVDRLTAPASNHAAFPPSPTRFIRKTSAPPTANGSGYRVRPASSTASSSETTTPVDKEMRKLPAYAGNERSRYGLPAEEKVKLKEERERLKREKEEKARREEEEKRQRKQDAQKTFEAWLRNKNVEIENSKKSGAGATASSRKKTLSPQPQMDEIETTPSPSSTVTFLTWLQNKKIQERQRKLQRKLQQIEIEELERKHTRQDAQQAYKRWLRRKALESEQLRISQRQRVVEERLNSSSSRSREVLDRFFESEHFASLGHHEEEDRQRTSTPALESSSAIVNGTA